MSNKNELINMGITGIKVQLLNPMRAESTIAAIPIHPDASWGFMCLAVKKWSNERPVPKRTKRGDTKGIREWVKRTYCKHSTIPA